MTVEQREVSSQERLPNELWLRVFGYLPPRDVFFSTSQTCRRWRALVQNNVRRLPLIPVHCRACVTDIDPQVSDKDGEDPMIQYSFTVFDRSLPDYKTKRRSCLRGNNRTWRALYISFNSYEGRRAEFEPRMNAKSYPLDQMTLQNILSYMCVEALRIEVLKQGKMLQSRRTDERLIHTKQFCESACGSVQIKSLLLSSENPRFPWIIGEKSMMQLNRFKDLETLVLENMATLNCCIFPEGRFQLDMQGLRDIKLKLSARHKQELEIPFWPEVDGSVLMSLLAVRSKMLDFFAYSDIPSIITQITADDMCSFVKGWRSQVIPWFIKSISFNSLSSISDFRTAACKQSLFTKHALSDIPYCRFRTYHPSDPNVLLELTCYGNGNATQWQIRSGYVKMK